ncbi:uncharacterized protein LOC101751112 isoform X4 [Gallus gallus]|uniref:uncharacterized protein LOC101751112 isoform X4 n=1 Tax=Gallus gallus TaxID=9031 RepID=UPI001AE1DCE0|nr:uncharacterized protein LOC101751112 isoform X4 [Gallus gallus]
MPWEITPKALLTSTCTKSLADDIHSSPRTYPAGDAIIEGYEVGQARFPLGEPMLTAPDDLLLQLPGDGTQNTLLHGLSRHRGEADCLRFPGSSFLPFLQICILLPPSSSRTPPSPRGQLSIPGLSLFPPGSQEGGLGSENCTKEGTQHLHLLSTPPLVPQGCAVEEPSPVPGSTPCSRPAAALRALAQRSAGVTHRSHQQPSPSAHLRLQDSAVHQRCESELECVQRGLSCVPIAVHPSPCCVCCRMGLHTSVQSAGSRRSCSLVREHISSLGSG